MPHPLNEISPCLVVNETRRYVVDGGGGILSESFLTKKNVPHPLNEISPCLVDKETKKHFVDKVSMKNLKI